MSQLQPRQPRLYDRGFLVFIRTKPCCICGAVGATEACHIRIGLFAKGMKPHDKHCTPMCGYHHREQHSMSESQFWEDYDLDPFDIAAKLYAEYGGDGGAPRKPRTTIKPRLPKEQRTKITSHKGPWPKRKFAR